jgi:hypothetical protein
LQGRDFRWSSQERAGIPKKCAQGIAQHPFIPWIKEKGPLGEIADSITQEGDFMNSRLLFFSTLFLLGVCFAQEEQKQTAVDPIKQNESAAAASMRTLNTAAITYKVAYKKAGYPPTLSSMATNGDSKDYNQEHAGLITEDLGCKNMPCAFHHYLFTYKKTGKGYVATARPQEYGVTGKLSLHSDQTAVIRGTFEDREATANDPPIDELKSE